MNKKRFMAFMLILTLFATVITPMAAIATETTEGTGSNNILSDIIQDSYSNNFDSEIALPVAGYGSVKTDDTGLYPGGVATNKVWYAGSNTSVAAANHQGYTFSQAVTDEPVVVEMKMYVTEMDYTTSAGVYTLNEGSPNIFLAQSVSSTSSSKRINLFKVTKSYMTGGAGSTFAQEKLNYPNNKGWINLKIIYNGGTATEKVYYQEQNGSQWTDWKTLHMIQYDTATTYTYPDIHTFDGIGKNGTTLATAQGVYLNAFNQFSGATTNNVVDDFEITVYKPLYEKIAEATTEDEVYALAKAYKDTLSLVDPSGTPYNVDYRDIYSALLEDTFDSAADLQTTYSSLCLTETADLYQLINKAKSAEEVEEILSRFESIGQFSFATDEELAKIPNISLVYQALLNKNFGSNAELQAEYELAVDELQIPDVIEYEFTSDFEDSSNVLGSGGQIIVDPTQSGNNVWALGESGDELVFGNDLTITNQPVVIEAKMSMHKDAGVMQSAAVGVYDESENNEISLFKVQDSNIQAPNALVSNNSINAGDCAAIDWVDVKLIYNGATGKSQAYYRIGESAWQAVNMQQNVAEGDAQYLPTHIFDGVGNNGSPLAGIDGIRFGNAAAVDNSAKMIDDLKVTVYKSMYELVNAAASADDIEVLANMYEGTLALQTDIQDEIDIYRVYEGLYDAKEAVNFTSDAALQEAFEDLCVEYTVPEDLVLADFTNSSDSAYSRNRSSLVYDATEGAAKFASPNLSGTIKVIPFTKSNPTVNDWSNYNTINIEMRGEQVDEESDSSYTTAIIYSDGTEATSSGYYGTKLCFTESDQPMTIQYKFDASEEDPTKQALDFTYNYDIIGFDNIHGFHLASTWGGNVLPEETTVYFYKIYLSYEIEERYDPTKNYIPEAITENIDATIKAQYESNQGNRSHPYLLTTSERLQENINLYNNNNTYLKNAGDTILRSADNILEDNPTPVQYSLVNGKRLVNTEREIIKTLSVAYHLADNNEDKIAYKNRLWASLQEMGSWKDWNPNHFLCTAEATMAFSMAYDLLYDVWTETQRRTIRNAIMRNGIEPAIKRWRINLSPASLTNNQQLVCSGGIGLGALALLNDEGYRDICLEMLSLIKDTLPNGLLAAYAPAGAFPEGVGYWAYATSYFSYLDKALVTSLGSDFGFANTPGFSQTGYFPITSIGPGGSFNFSDSTIITDISSNSVNSCMYWLSEVTNNKDFASYYTYYANQAGKSGGDIGFLMYNNNVVENTLSELPLDINWDSELKDPYYARGSWDDNTMWLGFLSGNNNVGHRHLDLGSFILDSQGVRWFSDLGSGDYNAEGYYVASDTWERDDFYRVRAEGHNTFIINPDANADQVHGGTVTVTDYQTDNTSGMYAVIDMKGAYGDKVDTAKRGFAFINNRSEVIVQDEITASEDIEYYSFFHTKHTITIDETNNKVAYLTANDGSGKQLRLDIISTGNESWGQMNAEPLATSPNPPGNNSVGYENTAYTKLYIHLDEVQSVNVSVLIRDNSANLDAAPPMVALQNWNMNLVKAYALYKDIAHATTAAEVETILANCSSSGLYAFETAFSELTAEQKTSLASLVFGQKDVFSKNSDVVTYYNTALDNL